MNCYLCSSTKFTPRKGQVRDDPELKILECQACGLVTLNSLEHIRTGHYENSGMHGEASQTMEEWLYETAEDDQRRFKMLHKMILNKKVLDFGSGNGGFMLQAEPVASNIFGIELEKRVKEHWKGRLNIFPNIQSVRGKYDLITAFHVIEHLPNPKLVLRKLSECLESDGQIVVEVPSSEDALITIYDCDTFQRFTYWSQHLFLFNADTLKSLAEQAGLKTVSVEQFQRYPLSNHLHWLSQGKPGGHKKWDFLNSLALQKAYSNALVKMNKCDTIIGYFEK